MRKMFLLVVVLVTWFSWLTYAISGFNYGSALKIANEYIENSSFDENWKNNNPKIIEKWRNFYTDSENVSYIEFKVSCDTVPDCWFIMINYDWDDVSIPISSTNWNTPSEILIAQNWGKSEETKLYYFSPFEQYSENIITWEVSSINPQDNIEQELEQDKSITKKEKNERRKNNKIELTERILKSKNEASAYKKTNDFKKKKKELKDNKQSIPTDEFSYKILPFANADIYNWTWTSTWYVYPGASNILISWSTTTNCNSKIPCYNQYTTPYNPPPVPYTSAVCYSWCSPTAVAMLYAYYDRQWTFPNLVPWTAVDSFTASAPDSNIVTMINSLKIQMWTTCVRSWSTNKYFWSTTSSNVQNAKQYAINKWYLNTISGHIPWTPWNLFPTIKSEINSNRPVIIHIQSTDTPEWHAIVWYWYKSTWTSYITRVNMWWWKTLVPLTNNTYWYSDYDIDLNFVYYNKSNNHKASGVTTFRIQ